MGLRVKIDKNVFRNFDVGYNFHFRFLHGLQLCVCIYLFQTLTESLNLFSSEIGHAKVDNATETAVVTQPSCGSCYGAEFGNKK